MRINLLLVSLLLPFIIGCNKDGSKGKSESCFSNSDARTLVHDSIDREYILYIPDSYDGTSLVPLMLNFHGFGGSASDFMSNADFRSLAESEIFILAYPQGSCLDGSSHWNPCPNGGDNKSTADDLGFVEALINDISSQSNIDLERVYAAGYSNGSMMAYGLANHKSNLIAAVASVSGTMLDCIGPTSHPMPVMHLHGTSDGVITYEGDGDFESTQSVLDHWISFNNTVASPTITTDESGELTIDHFVFDQGDADVSVEHYKYIEGGHDWISAKFQGKTTAELVWNFVSKYDINGLR